jgi:hypothetical protein
MPRCRLDPKLGERFQFVQPPVRENGAVKPGDPIDTKALDEQRARQRFELRSVPDWVMRRLAPKARDRPAKGDPGITELELRRLADDVTTKLGDVPARFEAHTRLDAVVTYLGDRRVDAHDTNVRAFEGLVDDLYEQRRNVIMGDIRDIDTALLVQYIHLRAYADELARDGYRDPRIESSA